MLIVDRDTILSEVSIKDVMDAVRGAYVEYSQKRAVVPIRTQIEMGGDNTGLFMPAYSPVMGSYGVKVVAVFPDNIERELPTISSTILLNDAETGLPAALMEAATITALRTGAASGIATDILALPAAERLTIIGCGVQAKYQLLAISEVRDLKEVTIFDIDRETGARFVAEMRNIMKHKSPFFYFAESADQAVREAEIIVTATTSKKPVFRGENLRPGVHINAVGAFTPTMQEIGEDTLLRADRVVVDSKEAVLEEAGDLIIPIQRGLFNPDQIYAEIGELIAKKEVVRKEIEEITLFETVGIAILDIAVARMIYDDLSGSDKGRRVDLF